MHRYVDLESCISQIRSFVPLVSALGLVSQKPSIYSPGSGTVHIKDHIQMLLLKTGDSMIPATFSLYLI